MTEGTAVIESDLIEHVPARYSDPEKTELTATIGAQGDGALQSELSGESKEPGSSPWHRDPDDTPVAVRRARARAGRRHAPLHEPRRP